jgi:hypothetical protein
VGSPVNEDGFDGKKDMRRCTSDFSDSLWLVGNSAQQQLGCTGVKDGDLRLVRPFGCFNQALIFMGLVQQRTI